MGCAVPSLRVQRCPPPPLPADRRAQILDVAMRLLDSVPFEQLSMDQVAAEAGVSSPLLFHYFKNKHGFRNAVLEASATELQRRMTPDTSLPLPAQLRAGVETFAEAVIAHPAIYLAVMRMAGSGDDGMRKIYRECGARSPRRSDVRSHKSEYRRPRHSRRRSRDGKHSWKRSSCPGSTTRR